MPDLIANGMEPEYFITDIVRTEPVGGGDDVRVYFACQKQGQQVVQMSVVGSATDLLRMAQRLSSIVATITDALVVGALLPKAH